MKLRERQDKIASELSRVVDALMEARTNNKFVLPYALRLQLDESRQALRGLGYEVIKPKELRLDALIKQYAKVGANANALTVQGITDEVLDALPKNQPAWGQVKAETSASGVLEATVYDYVEAETRAYLHGPELENIEF